MSGERESFVKIVDLVSENGYNKIPSQGTHAFAHAFEPRERTCLPAPRVLKRRRIKVRKVRAGKWKGPSTPAVT